MLKTAEATQKSTLAKSAAADLRSALGVPQPEQVAAVKKQQNQQKQAAAAKVKNENVRKAIDALIAAK